MAAHPLSFSFWILAAILFLGVYAAAPRPQGSTGLKMTNRAGKSIDVYWINTMKSGDTEEYILQNQKPIRHGTNTNINSYDTHSFLAEFHEADDDLKGVHVVFTKGSEDEDVYFDYDPKTKIMTANVMTKKMLIEERVKKNTEYCKELYIYGDGDGDGDGTNANDMNDFINCLQNDLVNELVTIKKNKEDLFDTRNTISHRLRNYTCADTTMKSSTPIRNYNWHHQGNHYQIDVLLDKPAAKIWIANDFVTDNECDILMKHAAPRLQRATVAAEDGSSVVSESRKAQQAAYMMEHDPNEKDDPLNELYARIFSMTNFHSNYNLKIQGQEGFTIIQYNPSDQYTPHCDGNCSGEKFKKYGRVATAVMYCKVAEMGGGTTFTNNDIFVKPNRNSVTFFSYKNINNNIMDDGDTEHSGCPVIAGEKWITTVWMREGVSNKVNETWHHYDPDGTRMGNDSDYEVSEDTTDYNDRNDEL